MYAGVTKFATLFATESRQLPNAGVYIVEAWSLMYERMRNELHLNADDPRAHVYPRTIDYAVMIITQGRLGAPYEERYLMFQTLQKIAALDVLIFCTAGNTAHRATASTMEGVQIPARFSDPRSGGWYIPNDIAIGALGVKPHHYGVPMSYSSRGMIGVVWAPAEATVANYDYQKPAAKSAHREWLIHFDAQTSGGELVAAITRGCCVCRLVLLT
jgi:hypothetical protein